MNIPQVLLHLFAAPWYAEPMTLHIFRSQKSSELFGFTIDDTGSNLPGEDGPWEKAGNAIPLGATMASTSPEIAKQVARGGYALVEGRSGSQPNVRRTESMP
jgi:hypothetical protein